MKLLKEIFLYAMIALPSSQALAGGVSGGGVMSASSLVNPEIVYHLGEQDGLVKFAHGTLVNGQWQVQTHALATEDVLKDEALTKALQMSAGVKDWISIK